MQSQFSSWIVGFRSVAQMVCGEATVLVGVRVGGGLSGLGQLVVGYGFQGRRNE